MSYWRLVEPYWDAVSIYDGWDTFARQFAALPMSSKHLYATHWTQSEVQNGGLDQFFQNDTGILAPEAVEGFRALGMPHTAELLTDAMSIFGAQYPRDRMARMNATIPVSIENQFSELLEAEAGGFWEAADRFAEVRTS